MNEIKTLPFDLNKLQTVAQDVLKEAARRGANQAAVSIGVNKGFSIGARNGDVETIEYNQDKAIDVTVLFGQRTGSASFSDLNPKAISAAVEAACHIAQFTDEDPAAGLADKSELAFHYPQLDLHSPWPISVEQAIEMACQCEREALAYDKKIMSAEEVRIATAEALHLHANSHGFMGYFPFTRHEISCVLIGKENEEMQRDYSYTAAASPEQLWSVSFVAAQAAEKTLKRLGAKRLPTTRTPVIFIAEEARGLLGHFAAAIQGGNLYRKATFLLDHLGKKIFPDFIHIQEQPHLAYALGSAPFDADGVATRANVFVNQGVLQNYSLSVYSARKLGMKTTGNAGGMHNLIIRSGNKDLTALIKMMNRGLLVTELMGQGINLVTGDYSRGAAGFWIENGEIQYPVHEITIAGKLQQMFTHILEVGNDIDTRGSIRAGSILLEEMMIAGI